jgi:hypothetical protein
MAFLPCPVLISPLPAMPYEPGSPECRVLINCKAQIETMLLTLSRIENSQHIRDQLVSVHNQLEGLHELHRRHPEASVAESVLLS